jgi:hypothetical protein
MGNNNYCQDGVKTLQCLFITTVFKTYYTTFKRFVGCLIFSFLKSRVLLLIPMNLGIFVLWYTLPAFHYLSTFKILTIKFFQNLSMFNFPNG